MKTIEKPLRLQRISAKIPKVYLEQFGNEVTVIPHPLVGVVAIDARMLTRLLEMAKEDPAFFENNTIFFAPGM